MCVLKEPCWVLLPFPYCVCTVQQCLNRQINDKSHESVMNGCCIYLVFILILSSINSCWSVWTRSILMNATLLGGGVSKMKLPVEHIHCKFAAPLLVLPGHINFALKPSTERCWCHPHYPAPLPCLPDYSRIERSNFSTTWKCTVLTLNRTGEFWPAEISKNLSAN